MMDIIIYTVAIVPTVIALNYYMQFDTIYILRIILFIFITKAMSFITNEIEHNGGKSKTSPYDQDLLKTFSLMFILAALSGYNFFRTTFNDMSIYEQAFYGIATVYFAIKALGKLEDRRRYLNSIKHNTRVAKATIANNGATNKRAGSKVKKDPTHEIKKTRKEVYDEAMKELDSIIGMDKVKAEVERFLINVEMMKKKEALGIKNDKSTMHMLFIGPPGTGKTTIARIIAKLLYGMGLLSKGHCIEARRKDLISGYVGQTAGKTYDMIQSAIGGVLFIDEAYSLNPKPQGFEQEALDTLNQEMEENRKDLVVILAGYEDKMEEFLDANEGFRSRIPHKFHFEPYNKTELYEIAKKLIEDRGYILNDEADKELIYQIERLAPIAENSNGRLMRNLLERIQTEQNYRLKKENASNRAMVQITATDIKYASNYLLSQ